MTWSKVKKRSLQVNDLYITSAHIKCYSSYSLDGTTTKLGHKDPLPDLHIGCTFLGVKGHQKVTGGHLVKIYATPVNERYNLTE